MADENVQRVWKYLVKPYNNFPACIGFREIRPNVLCY